MNAQEYFDFIVNETHSVVFATSDGQGRPVTCAIDIMDYDEKGLYFLTAKGKNFYDRLKANEDVAFTAMKGEDTLSCMSVSIQGKAKEIGPDRLSDLFCKNPYMEKIYPDVRSRSALTVFQIYAGTGEWFDLSKFPIERVSFSFGGAQAKRYPHCRIERRTNGRRCPSGRRMQSACRTLRTSGWYCSRSG